MCYRGHVPGPKNVKKPLLQLVLGWPTFRDKMPGLHGLFTCWGRLRAKSFARQRETELKVRKLSKMIFSAAVNDFTFNKFKSTLYWNTPKFSLHRCSEFFPYEVFTTILVNLLTSEREFRLEIVFLLSADEVNALVLVSKSLFPILIDVAVLLKG